MLGRKVCTSSSIVVTLLLGWVGKEVLELGVDLPPGGVLKLDICYVRGQLKMLVTQSILKERSMAVLPVRCPSVRRGRRC